MAISQAAVVGFVTALVMLQSSASKLEQKHLDLCDEANSTLNVLIPKVDAAKKGWKSNCQAQLTAFNEVKGILNQFEVKKKKLRIKNMPGRELLLEMTEDCDDVISTMKGIIKHVTSVKNPLSCSNKQEVSDAANKMWNRVFRCGFGQRGKTLSSSVLAEVESKALVGLRRKREAILQEENELSEMPVEGVDGVVAFIKGDPSVAKVENSIQKLLRLRNVKGVKATAGRSLFNVRVEHKCSCQNSDCKCCLLIFKGNEAEEAYSACLGLEILQECKRKGLRIFVEFMGLSTGLTIMEGSSACYNFPSIPVSLCIEPYAFHFCPRRGTFRACLMLQFEVLGFKVASYNLHCFVLSYTKDNGIGLRLRKAKDHWLPQLGIINVLFNWVSDIVVTQYLENKNK